MATNSFVKLMRLFLCYYTTLAAIDFDSFDFQTYLDSNNEFLIAWTVDSTKTNITIGVSAPTTGWAAIGLSPTGQMPTSDIALFWVDDTDGTVHLEDRYTSTSRSTPALDTNQNLILIQGEQLNGKTNIIFKRAITPCDSQTGEDYPIVIGTSRVIYAYAPNNMDTFTYHLENRASKSVNLLDGTDLKVDLESDYKTFDVVVNNYNMPIDKTTYYETIHELPVNGSDIYHIIKFEPIVTPGNELHVHHFVLYYCDANVTTCRTAAYAWAIGGEGLTFPANVGLEMSMNYLHFVKLQIHYDNPNQISSVFDSSGLRIYYTETLRANDAGLIEFGLALGVWQFIPPGMTEALNTAYCMSECTDATNAIPNGGVYAFNVLLHQHVLGTAIELKHIRNGIELEPIAANWAYDFDYQQSLPLSQHKQILPGDEFILDCFYDSTDAMSITYGGESTEDEMCQAYVYVYPRPKLGKCISEFTDVQTEYFFNLAAQAGYLTGTDESNYEYNIGGNPFTANIANIEFSFENGEELYNCLWQSAELNALRTRDITCKDIDGVSLRSGAFEIPNGFTVYNQDTECTQMGDGMAPQTTSNIISEGCTNNDILEASGILDDFDINIEINCVEKTVTITIKFSNYKQNWFGIVFSDKMLGNALIWTTHNPGNNEAERSLSLYSYSITDRIANMIRYDGIELNWNKISETINNEIITVKYAQDLSKTKSVFSLDTTNINIKYAYGDTSLVLSQHLVSARSSSTLGLNLLTGGSSTIKDDLTLETIHGIIMWITWAVLASYGIMSSAFRFLYPDGPKWFYIHRGIQCCVVIFDLIGFIIAIVFTIKKEKTHFNNPHMIMGLIVTLLCILQPINAYFRVHPPSNGWENGIKPNNRIIWEYLHRGTGYIAWILTIITAYLGLKIFGKDTLANVHLFGWGVLLLIIYIILTILKYKRNKQEKQISFEETGIEETGIQETPTNTTR